ncbi:MAG: lytic transglycosylase domain-containing protein, partial [Pseudomonadota bacterium]
KKPLSSFDIIELEKTLPFAKGKDLLSTSVSGLATATLLVFGLTVSAQARTTPHIDYGQAIFSQGAALDYAPSLENAFLEAGLPLSAVTELLGIQTAAARATGLPSPRDLSDVQSPAKTMYRLARSVGEQYAQHDEVRDAGLGPTEFVALFTTLIQRESNFDPDAQSPAGAQGLGQLMPRTARALGVDDAFSPEDNLDASARYLVKMLGQFGKTEHALAAYNAGPGNVNKHGGIPPFTETRQYVSDILHNTTIKLR